LGLDEPRFAALFAGSPIRRARRAGFLRNVCVALGNRAGAGAVPALATAMASDGDALVRAHAAWALGEIGRRIGAARAAGGVDDVARALRAAAAGDADPAVREEAVAALGPLAYGASGVPLTHSPPPSA